MGITKLDSCSIIGFLDPLVLFRTDYIVCT